jgi:2-polyprenyl-6-methoxyphenol hydroxylase-like FAD-dependent oxidoreductase
MRTAIVVGGGIGGLGAAVGLRLTGWDVTVLERRPSTAPAGTGLVLQANGMRCLDELGLGDAVRAGGRPDAGGGTRTSDGRWLARIDGDIMAELLGTSAVGIHRAVLHGILLDALPSGTVHTGATVTGASADGTVTYRLDGVEHTRHADLVVGADGINSAVRAALWPENPGPARVGVIVWRGVTRDPWPGDIDVAISWGRGEEFGVVPLLDGRVYWFAAINGPAPLTDEDPVAAVLRRFGGWHDPVPALVGATDPATILHDDLRCLDVPLPTYVRGDVVLLGDAAHAMTPNLGQGANQALEDAVVLAATAGSPDRYDRDRRPRSQKVARVSRRIGRMSSAANPVVVAARNALMRVTPPRAALRSMARYADWTPPELGR